MAILNPTTTVQEVLQHHPEAARVFVNRCMFCPGCPAEAFHTLAEAARFHGRATGEFLAELCAAIATGKGGDPTAASWHMNARIEQEDAAVNVSNIRECAPVDISEQDVLKAMKAMQGYIDITPADFREVYRVAYALAKDRMMNALKAADVMSSPVHVVPLAMDLIETATLLADKGITGAPVVDDAGKIVGVVSEKDFLVRMGAARSGSFMQVVAHCLKNKGCVATPLHNRKIGDIMTAPPITATADISIGEIAALFMEKKINRLPIIAADGRPSGIVTRSDLVNSYCMLG